MIMAILFYLLCSILATFILFGFVALFAGPGGRGVPFVPTSRKHMRAMIRLAGEVRGKRIADLGSGDGKVVIVFAAQGAEAHGYELNLILVWWSRLRIMFSRKGGRAHVHWGNYWKKDFSGFDVVIVFGLPPMMGKLEEKLRRELRPGACVLSNSFSFPTWMIEKQEDGVRLYVK